MVLMEFGSILVRRSRYQANNLESRSTYFSFLPAPPSLRRFLPKINEKNVLGFIENQLFFIYIMKNVIIYSILLKFRMMSNE